MDVQQELQALYKKALELKSQGQSTQAEAVEIKAAALLESLKIQAHTNPDDLETASALLYLAERDWAILGDDERVHAQLERALAIREKELGPNHPLTAEAMAKIGEVHFLAGRFGEAEVLYKQAVAIYAKQGDSKDPMRAKALEGLAQTLAALGRPQEADPYFSQAIDSVGSDEQGKRTRYFLLIFRADGLEKLNRHSEAEALRQKAAALLPKANPGEFGFRV